MLWDPPPNEWIVFMPAAPNWHFLTQWALAPRLSAINDLKGCSRVKFALILLRKKGQISRLGAQCSTARSCSSAVGPMALSTITGRAFQPIVCTSTIVGDQLQQVT